MKKIAALIVYVLVILGCAGRGGDSWYAAHNPDIDKRTYVKDITSMSIALVDPKLGVSNEKLGYNAFCGGVWFSKTMFITAMHCAQHAAEDDITRILRMLTGAQPDAETYIGATVEYTTHRLTPEEMESGLITVVPVMTGTIIAGDYDTDLAIVRADSDPGPHGIASFRSVTSMVSDRLFVIGHPAGKLFSYSEIYIAGIRYMSTVDGIFPVRLIEVKGPIWFGNSGGGAFDGQGKVAGICSFKHGKYSDISYFIHHATINEFIARNRTRLLH